MRSTFLDAVAARRSCYELDGEVPIPETRIEEIIDRLLLTVPSPFNGQSTRIVLLLGSHHYALWSIVKEALRAHVSPERFPKTAEKIDQSFTAGYGTVLFFEDQRVVEEQKALYPLYADKMEDFTSQSSAMHEFALWTAFADEGIGASLQHYNPLIDDEVRLRWEIDPAWRLVAQMPFGVPRTEPKEKSQHLPLEARRIFFEE